MALDLFGTRLDLSLGGAGAAHLERAISAAWNRCLAPTAAPSPSSVVEVVLDGDHGTVSAARDRGAVADTDEVRVMDWLSSRLTVEAITPRFGQLWMLHACAVADGTSGATVVLVAPSGTGKTTAAIALGRHFGYLTDETAAVCADGTMMPYPKPLSALINGERPKRQHSPDELGLLPTPPNPWLAAVALLDRSGTGGPSVTPVRTVEALPLLAEQTSALQRLPRPLHLVAGHLQRTGGLRRITYQEADDLTPVVSALLEGAS